MKLLTILKFKKEIDELKGTLNIIEEDYLTLLDDDLWTVDIETKPHFTDEYDVAFTTEVKLTRKYVIRFCEDYGLSLKSFEETDKRYSYLFELEKDIMKSVNLLGE